jgi:hypothetical protein
VQANYPASIARRIEVLGTTCATLMVEILKDKGRPEAGAQAHAK